MYRRLCHLTALLSFLTLDSSVVSAISKSDLYPFGAQNGDHTFRTGDDLSSRWFDLQTSIRFYGDNIPGLHVNTNGLLTFDVRYKAFKSNEHLPLRHRAIVPFLADVDTRDAGGNIYFRETDNSLLNELATHQITRAFSDQRNFRPASLFIATWEEVGHYSRQHQKKNTFQVVVASDGDESFVLFLYPENGIQWIVSDGKEAPLSRDVPAQAGICNGANGQHIILPGSGTTRVNVSLTQSVSNTGIPGLWIFRVGNLAGGNVAQPSARHGGNPIDAVQSYLAQYKEQLRRSPALMSSRNTLSGSLFMSAGDYEIKLTPNTTFRTSDILDTDNTCETPEETDCGRNAACENNCCQCAWPYVGNGHECIRQDEEQRIAGRMLVSVNRQTVENITQHTYVTTDGRMCSAFSGIPPTVGNALQSVYVVGSFFGFLFAVPQDSTAFSGFMRVGGLIVRTATLNFETTRGVVEVSQSIIDEFEDNEMLKLQTLTIVKTRSGQLPSIPAGARVEIDDYAEEFQRVAPGVIHSQSTHSFRVNSVQHRFTLNQTIVYRECAAGRTLSDLGKMRIDATRNYVTYSDKGQLMRFCQTTELVEDD